MARSPITARWPAQPGPPGSTPLPSTAPRRFPTWAASGTAPAGDHAMAPHDQVVNLVPARCGLATVGRSMVERQPTSTPFLQHHPASVWGIFTQPEAVGIRKTKRPSAPIHRVRLDGHRASPELAPGWGNRMAWISQPSAQLHVVVRGHYAGMEGATAAYRASRTDHAGAPTLHLGRPGLAADHTALVNPAGLGGLGGGGRPRASARRPRRGS